MSDYTYTNSEIQCFKACRQRWYFSYIERLRKRLRPDYFMLGSYVHSIADSWHEGDCQTIDAALELYEEISIADIGEAKRELDKMAMRYPGRPEFLPYSGDDLDTMQVVGYGMIRRLLTSLEREDEAHGMIHFGSEIYFKVRIFEKILLDLKVYLSGRIDRLCGGEAGRIWLGELKTAATWGPQQVAMLEFDEQSTCYLYAFEKFLRDANPSTLGELLSDAEALEIYLGEHRKDARIRGVIYDVIRKPSKRQRTKTGETLEEYRDRLMNDYIDPEREAFYFSRNIIVRNPDDMLEYEADLLHTIQDMIDCEFGDKRIYRGARMGNSQFWICSYCSYRPICKGQGCGDEELKAQLYEVSPVRHPELEQWEKETGNEVLSGKERI